MRVEHLSLSHFRNYDVAEIGFAPGLNALIGFNGQGKTNLIEAIGFFSFLRSHRVSSSSPLIQADQASATVRMRLTARSRQVSLEYQLFREKPTKAQISGNPAAPRELPRWFSSIAFTPEDLSLIRGEPLLRRRFLDDALSARFPLASTIIRDYERVVKQRTKLLKTLRSQRTYVSDSLVVWDEQLISLGSQIILARRELLRDLFTPLRSAYFSLVAEDHFPSLSMAESIHSHESDPSSVSRETSCELCSVDVSRETLEDLFRTRLNELREKEFERAATLVGPHRDDVLFTLRGLPVKGYASHGETWSFALSLKLAIAHLLRQESSAGDPVLILDDVFAELDSERRERLMGAIAEYEQVIITAAVEDDIPQNHSWRKIFVQSGTVSESHD